MADDFRDLFKDWKPGDDPEGGDGVPERENRQPRALREKEVRVLGVFAVQAPSNAEAPLRDTCVLLRDGLGRKIPIFIGLFETMAIQHALEGVVSDRPLTHDLLRNIVERFGGSVERVIIDDLWQGTFYAKILLSRKTTTTETLEIDARSSDAIALALRARAPIYVAEDVLEQAAQDEDT